MRKVSRGGKKRSSKPSLRGAAANPGAHIPPSLLSSFPFSHLDTNLRLPPHQLHEDCIFTGVPEEHLSVFIFSPRTMGERDIQSQLLIKAGKNRL